MIMNNATETCDSLSVAASKRTHAIARRRGSCRPCLANAIPATSKGGFIAGRSVCCDNTRSLTEEWRRPTGQRRKDPAVLRYMFCSITQRSLIAPVVWISVTLMDGKSFLCAFSVNLDLRLFGNGSTPDLAKADLVRLLAKIPCKDVFDGEQVVSREAASRYLRCISQACGWTFLLLTTLVAFTVRAVRPCFTQAVFLKTKYWSHYVDIERKMFEETCTEHAKSFARICIQQYFESVGGEMQGLHGQHLHEKDKSEDEGEKPKSDEEKLLGIRAQDDMDKVLWNWHTCKPPLNVKKEDFNSANSNGTININGFSNNLQKPDPPKKEWVAYYSKV
uniref:Calcium homeostasis modulator 1 n=1 Tax=Paramormyrops kingsleyae TaxID=1676925 RepID=A0A3B3RBC5_9TELE